MFLLLNSVNEELTWTSLDTELLKCCSAKNAVPEAVSEILSATSHHAVKVAVSRLSMHFLVDNSIRDNHRVDGEKSRALARELFYSCGWRTALER